MRRGYCKEGCGACCKFLVLQVNPAYYAQEDTRRWVELHGIRLAMRNGACWAYVPTPCSALEPDMKCGLYGKPERPKLCETWPASQADIDELHSYTSERCTYFFEEEPIG